MDAAIARRRQRAVITAIALGLLVLAAYVATFYRIADWLPALVR